MLLDTIRYTLFLSALGGSYVAIDEGLALVGGKQRCVCLQWWGKDVMVKKVGRERFVASQKGDQE